MKFAVIIQDSITLSFWVTLIISSLSVLFCVYILYIDPFLKKRKRLMDNPPEEGNEYEFVVPETSRFFRFQIGQTTGDLITLCSSIMNDHLIIQFKKELGEENYTITFLRNGAASIKPPKTKYFSKMELKEKFESYEIIGNSIDFRISDKIYKDRMVQYFEFSLISKFIKNKNGAERMKFIIKITKIHPALNFAKANRYGVVPFGKVEEKSNET